MATTYSSTKEVKSLHVIAAAGAFIQALQKATGMKTFESQQQLLLLSLYVHGEMAQQNLDEFTGVEKSSISRNIARLGDGERPLIKRGPGWVESFEDPADRRNKMVRLTPRGKALLDQVAREVAPHFST
jgi:DNA-binding MarR family transcriptional regulator